MYAHRDLLWCRESKENQRKREEKTSSINILPRASSEDTLRSRLHRLREVRGDNRGDDAVEANLDKVVVSF